MRLMGSQLLTRRCGRTGLRLCPGPLGGSPGAAFDGAKRPGDGIGWWLVVVGGEVRGNSLGEIAGTATLRIQ